MTKPFVDARFLTPEEIKKIDSERAEKIISPETEKAAKDKETKNKRSL